MGPTHRSRRTLAISSVGATRTASCFTIDTAAAAAAAAITSTIGTAAITIGTAAITIGTAAAITIVTTIASAGDPHPRQQRYADSPADASRPVHIPLCGRRQGSTCARCQDVGYSRRRWASRWCRATAALTRSSSCLRCARRVVTAGGMMLISLMLISHHVLWLRCHRVCDMLRLLSPAVVRVHATHRGPGSQIPFHDASGALPREHSSSPFIGVVHHDCSGALPHGGVHRPDRQA